MAYIFRSNALYTPQHPHFLAASPECESAGADHHMRVGCLCTCGRDAVLKSPVDRRDSQNRLSSQQMPSFCGSLRDGDQTHFLVFFCFPFFSAHHSGTFVLSLREFFVKRQTGSLRAVCLVDVDAPIWIVIGTECELGRSLPEATGADEALMQSFVEALRSHRAGAHVLLASKK